MALGISAGSAAAQRIDPKTFVAVKGAVSAESVATGGSAEVTVAVEIKGGIHIQAHKPTEDFAIPTVLTLEKAEGLTFGEVKYPEPVLRTYPAISETPLAVYDGKIELKFPVAVAKDAAAGAREIKGTLKFQGCDDKVCYSPAKVEIKISITVVPAK